MKSKILNAYDWFLIVGVVVSNILYSVLTGSVDLVGSVAAITGVFCVVLVAKGSIWNYLFGLVNVSLYAYISYKASIYGDAGLNAFYYLPMQFIGWWQWRKRGAVAASDQGQVQVKARRMTMSQRLFLTLGCAACIAVLALILDKVGDPQPVKDSATTVLSIVAQALMAMAFMEQWALWIITNVISVGMWVVCLTRGDAHAGVMVIMWIFYLMNSINGFRVWLRLSAKD